MNCQPSSQGLKANELQPYVNEFVKIAYLYDRVDVVGKTRSMRIVFGDPGKQNFAACYYMLNEIVINKESFMKLGHENREELVFHELRHCALDQQHTEIGIMKAQGLHNPQYYRLSYNRLINQLFKDKATIQYNPNKYPQGKTMSKKAEILEQDHAVVRFTAEWCPPCKAMKPIFEEVALANPAVKVYVIDIDKDQETAVDFGVRGIPTLIKIVDKAEQTRTVGGQTKEAIEELFRK